MECFYIESDESNIAKNALENNFMTYKKNGWDLSIFSRKDEKNIDLNNVNGDFKASEKANFMSHKRLITEHLNNDNSIFILEGNAIFGRHTCDIIDNILLNNKRPDWDVLFTNILAPSVSTMFDFIQLRPNLQNNQIAFIDLSMIPFTGSTGYILNQKAKVKLFNLLESEKDINIPYHLFISKLIQEKNLMDFYYFHLLHYCLNSLIIQKVKQAPHNQPI